MFRSARKMPPGPIESAMCMKTPYRAGTSMSFSQAPMPPTEMATIAKSVPRSAARCSVVAVMSSLQPSAAASCVPRSRMTAARPASISISRSCAPA